MAEGDLTDALGILAGNGVGAAGVHVGALWVLAGSLVLIALLGAKRLPVGVSPALGLTALAGALLLTNAARPDGLSPELRMAAVLAAMIGISVGLASAGQRTTDRPNERALANGDVAKYAGGVFSLLTAAVALGLPADAPALERLGMTICLLVGAVVWAIHRAPEHRCWIYALVACCVWIWTPAERNAARGDNIAIGILALGLVGLAIGVGTIVQGWRQRQRAWLSEPEKLLDPPPRRAWLYGFVLGGCVLAAIAGPLAADRVLTPLGLFLAALAALTVEHRRAGGTAGAIGMILIGEGLIVAASAWLPAAGTNAVLGSALAGVYLLWLARFWRQQLNEGKPWTTAGRLIPTARRMGRAAGGAAFVLAAAQGLGPPAPEDGAWVLTACAGLLLLMLAALSLREAAEQNSAGAAFAACLALLAAGLPAQLLARRFNLELSQTMWLAPAGVLLALRLVAMRYAANVRPICNGFVGGLIPAGVALGFTVRGVYGEGASGAVIAVAGVVAAVALWFGPRWRESAGRGAETSQA